MIHYQLRCSQGHEFDGWFNDSASFDMQARSGLLECPVCADTRVERALMAPAVPRKGAGRELARMPPPQAAPGATPPAETSPVLSSPGPSSPGPSSPGPASPVPASPGPASPAVTSVAGRLPDHLRAVLQRMRAEVEKNCDYVGPSFAEEARRIHRGEGDRRGIYGETSPGEAEALAEEGIEVARIPWVPRADG